jgi:gluconate kinase
MLEMVTTEGFTFAANSTKKSLLGCSALRREDRAPEQARSKRR